MKFFRFNKASYGDYPVYVDPDAVAVASKYNEERVEVQMKDGQTYHFEDRDGSELKRLLAAKGVLE